MYRYVHTQAELIRARGSLHEDNYGASKNIMRQPLFSVTIELIHAASHFGTEPFWHATGGTSFCDRDAKIFVTEVTPTN